MSILSSLQGITLTNGDITTAEAAGVDLPGLMQTAQQHCFDMGNLLAKIEALMTTAGDSANGTTITTQITAIGVSPLAQ
jgi:hypothetical protein